MESGRLVAIRYQGHDLWHTRLLLEKVGSSTTNGIILTPDSDMYAENFANSNDDIDGFRLLS
eukprot:4091318-Karenia_brevis.AAC.1